VLRLAVAFGIVAVFLDRRRAAPQPQRGQGLGGALQQLAQEPFGPLLAAVALGLMTYGIFSFAEARYRRLAGK
jgi:Domain of Unknown Function (DUF1206)